MSKKYGWIKEDSEYKMVNFIMSEVKNGIGFQFEYKGKLYSLLGFTLSCTNDSINLEQNEPTVYDWDTGDLNEELSEISDHIFEDLVCSHFYRRTHAWFFFKAAEEFGLHNRYEDYDEDNENQLGGEYVKRRKL
ncbi:hypothetical protein NSS82_19175 [Paenibacillus sp. FSL H7-0735]|uniref:hypothetical protein n=1 Tax=Paenibacillus sp. FSL H7-0735 TaxID=2954736 RepID=UPI0030FBE444